MAIHLDDYKIIKSPLSSYVYFVQLTLKSYRDKVMASAIIDRIVHHAEIIKITGSRYRIKDYKGESIEINEADENAFKN